MNDVQFYHFGNEENLKEYARTRDLLREYNSLPYMDFARKEEIIRALFGRVGKDFRIEPHFECDFGKNIFLGENVGINFGCTILDDARIEIGSDTLIAPNVNILAAYHPKLPEERKKTLPDGHLALKVLSAPITIGDNVWIGGGSTILAGVEIGEGAIIGAGSVVSHSIPPRTIAVGSPCRVIKENKKR